MRPSAAGKSTRTACALIVIPRSRSSSIESSICSRMSRSATVRVSCRMRSASVDLPWSMWAMIEKLRIVESGTLVAYWRCLRPALTRWRGLRSRSASETEHLHVGELQDPARRQVRRAAGGEREPDRHDLRRQRAAEDLVERPPHAERRGRAVDGRDDDPRRLAGDLGQVQRSRPGGAGARSRTRALQRRDDRRREGDAGGPERLVEREVEDGVQEQVADGDPGRHLRHLQGEEGPREQQRQAVPDQAQRERDQRRGDVRRCPSP